MYIHIVFLYACEKQVILYIDETFEVTFTNLALKILCTRDDSIISYNCLWINNYLNKNANLKSNYGKKQIDK